MQRLPRTAAPVTGCPPRAGEGSRGCACCPTPAQCASMHARACDDVSGPRYRSGYERAWIRSKFEGVSKEMPREHKVCVLACHFAHAVGWRRGCVSGNGVSVAHTISVGVRSGCGVRGVPQPHHAAVSVLDCHAIVHSTVRWTDDASGGVWCRLTRSRTCWTPTSLRRSLPPSGAVPSGSGSRVESP